MLAAERACGAFVDAYMSDLGLQLLMPAGVFDMPSQSRLTPSSGDPPLVLQQLPPWHRRCLAAALRWLQSEPEGGGATRGNVLFNAIVAGCLTQIHLESLVEV